MSKLIRTVEGLMRAREAYKRLEAVMTLSAKQLKQLRHLSKEEMAQQLLPLLQEHKTTEQKELLDPLDKSRPPRIYRPPGFKLQDFAEFWYSPKTNENILEPVLRDLQDEHMEALVEGRPRKAQWVRIRGTWAFWAATVAQLPTSLIKWLKAFVT